MNTIKLAGYTTGETVMMKWDAAVHWHIRTDNLLQLSSTLMLIKAYKNIPILYQHLLIDAIRQITDGDYPPIFPPAKMFKPEWIFSTSWPGIPTTFFPDMRIPEVRNLIYQFAVREAQILDIPVVGFDNTYAFIKPTDKYPLTADETTAAYLQFAKENWKRDDRYPIVYNIACPRAKFPTALNGEPRTEGIGQYANGIAYEQYDPNIDAHTDAIARYIRNGKMVLLFLEKTVNTDKALQKLQPLATTYNNPSIMQGVYVCP